MRCVQPFSRARQCQGFHSWTSCDGLTASSASITDPVAHAHPVLAHLLLSLLHTQILLLMGGKYMEVAQAVYEEDGDEIAGEID